MRRPFRSAVVLSVLAPALVVAPAILPDTAPEPRPVTPEVQEIALPDAAAGLEAQTKSGASTDTGELDTEPFEVLGVTWAPTPGLGEVAVAVRTRTEDGDWTGWSDIGGPAQPVQEAAAPGVVARGGTEPVWVGPSDGVQVRIGVVSGSAPQDVKVALVDPGESPADAAVSTGQEHAASAAAAAPRPQIRSRAEWGADEGLRRGNPSYSGTVRAITLHHTASGNSYDQDDVPALIRGFYAYHTRSQGWSDIGYNFLVDKYGGIWEGRHGGIDRPVLGSHAGGFNTDTAGVSMIGNYDTAATNPTMMDAVARVMAWKLSLHGRDPHGSVTLTSRGSTRYSSGTPVTLPVIFGHRDVSSTACPGRYGVAEMPSLRDRVAAHMAGSAPARANTAPVGVVDEAREETGADPSSVYVRGWAMDADTPNPVDVNVIVDGTLATTRRADEPRPDVGRAYGNGDAHGWSATVPAAAGTREVCVEALDAETRTPTRIGCQYVAVGPQGPPPLGSLDGVTVVPGGLYQRGWAYDPGAKDSTTSVDVVLDGRVVGTATTGLPRPDVSRAVEDASDDTGWSLTVAAPPGRHQLCAVAHRSPRTGAGTGIGCKDVWILEGHQPLGHLDAVQTVPGEGVRVRGWALDPDTWSSSRYRVLVDGRPVAEGDATRSRTDIERIFAGYGSFHGFDASVPLSSGWHDVCVEAVNREAGSGATRLGCARRIASGNPYGHLDAVRREGDVVRVSGWAIDPDHAGASGVRIQVGTTSHGLTAGGDRPDLVPHYQAGAAHGFDERLPVGPEQTSVCVWALNAGAGNAHELLGCRSV